MTDTIDRSTQKFNLKRAMEASKGNARAASDHLRQVLKQIDDVRVASEKAMNAILIDMRCDDVLEVMTGRPSGIIEKILFGDMMMSDKLTAEEIAKVKDGEMTTDDILVIVTDSIRKKKAGLDETMKKDETVKMKEETAETSYVREFKDADELRLWLGRTFKLSHAEIDVLLGKRNG